MTDVQAVAPRQPLQGGRDEDAGQGAPSRRRDAPPRELGKTCKHQTNQGLNIRKQTQHLVYTVTRFYTEPVKGTSRKLTTGEQL